MYTVKYYNEDLFDEMTMFTGTLDECRAYADDVNADADALELPTAYIVAPDGFTVVE